MVSTIGLTGLDAWSIKVVAALQSTANIPEQRDTRVRVRAALAQIGHDTPNNIGFSFPKPQPCFDVAAPIAVLIAQNKLPASAVEGTAFVGELSLTGAVRPVRGVLSRVQGAAKLGFRRVVVPTMNRQEACLVNGVDVFHVDHLADLLEQLARGVLSAPVPQREKFSAHVLPVDYVDFAEVRGQSAARRALEIAAVGGHNVLMIGSPGAGKTMLARRLPTILPPITEAEALEVTAIHSVAGLLGTDRGIVQVRPFRAPHHSVSPVGLVGGGAPIRPGEISLAHRGVLFLDEILEFQRGALDALREPMREGKITICRRDERCTFPALAQVIAGANPCPCGFHGDKQRRCTCTPERIAAYRKRLADLYYFPIRIHLPPIDVAQLVGQPRGEDSATIRARVVKAREFAQTQRKRNAEGVMDGAATTVLTAARDRLPLNDHQERRIVTIAQTIAHLAHDEQIRKDHIAEAIPLAMHID